MAEKHTDLVCGMEVTEENAACSFEYQGKTYYFCAEACRDQFAQNPEEHISRRQ